MRKANKIKVPINMEINNFKFPYYEEIEIIEGIMLFAIPDNNQPLVNLTALFPLGANSEPKAGVSYFSSQMLKRGTKKRNSLQIAEEFDRLGASLNISSNWDYTKAAFTSLGKYFDNCIEMLSDCIYNSTFKKDEIERFKTKHLADIGQELADPSYLTEIAFHKGIFGNYSYGHPLIGTKRTVRSFDKNDCKQWYEQLLAVNKITLVVSGNFNKQKIIKSIKKYFHLKSGLSLQKLKSFKQLPLTESKLILKNKRGSEQTNLRIGKLTINRNHTDFPGLQFANTAFGGFFLSRLNNLLREELGYTYGVNSFINSKKLASVFTISTSINKDTTSDTVNRILEQMDLMNKNKITEEEFILVKRYILGSFLRSMETSRQIAALLKNQIIYDLPNNYYNDFYQRIKQISIDEIFECQKKYFANSDLLIVAVGEMNKFDDGLSI